MLGLLTGTLGNINTYLAGTWGDIPGVKKITQVRHPTDTFCFVEEFDARGFNVGSFVVNPEGDRWNDAPVSWHRKGTCLSFADTHVEYWRWSDQRTWALNSPYTYTPNNPDLVRIQAASGYQ